MSSIFTANIIPGSFSSLFKAGFHGASWNSNRLIFRDPLRDQQLGTLYLLESTYRDQLDPAPLFAAFSKEQRGYYRRTLRRFSQRMANGTSIVDALEQTPDVLEPNMVLAIRHGVLTGTLPATFSMLKAEADERRQSANNELDALKMYWLAVGFVVLIILIYISQRISRPLQKIFEEFGLQRAEFLADFNYVMNAILLSLPWLILAIILLSVTGLLPQARAWFRRRVKPLFSYSKDLQATATLLRLLSIQLQQRKDITNSFAILAKYHSRKSIRQQLLVARNEAELGLDVWQSLSTSQLITEKEGQALAKAGEPGSQAWLLDRLAESLDHRVNRRTDRQVVIVTPLVTFFWGAIVILAAQVVLFSIASIITSLS